MSIEPYYERDGCVIYHADCRDVIPHVAADALITDPPYGVNLGDGGSRSIKGARTYSAYSDSRSEFDATVVPSIAEALRIVRRGMVFMGIRSIWQLPEPTALGGVYNPAGAGFCSWGPITLHHVAFYGHATPHARRGLVLRSSEHARDGGNHPCPKPIGWMRWAVSLSSQAGEVVLDPFMGSGTTLVAARDLGRRAIGIEIDEAYCEIAAKRLDQGVLFAPVTPPAKPVNGTLL